MSSATAPPLLWSTWREACRVVAHPPHLLRTCTASAIIGTVLFAINHLDTVIAGKATTTLWVKTAVTYLVPFAVSNYGLLIGCRGPRRNERRTDPP